MRVLDTRPDRRLQEIQRFRPRFDHIVERERRRGGVGLGSFGRRGGDRRLGCRRGGGRGWRRRGRSVGRRLRRPLAAGEHRSARRGRRTRRRSRRSHRRDSRGGRRHGRTVADALFEPFDAVEERLLPRARFAARDAHDGNLEHEPRVGHRLPTNVDDRFAQDLDRAHDRGVAHVLRQRGEALALFRRAVVRDAAGCVRLEKGVAQCAQQIVGNAAYVVARRDEVVYPDQRRRDVVARGRFQHCEAHLEGRAAQRRLHLLGADRAAADRKRLVEQRQRVAGRAAGAAGDEIEGLGIGLDAFLGQDVGEIADS